MTATITPAASSGEAHAMRPIDQYAPAQCPARRVKQ